MTEKKGNLMEGMVQLACIRLTTAADSPTHQRAFTDTMGDSVSDLPREAGVRRAWPNSAYSASKQERTDNS